MNLPPAQIPVGVVVERRKSANRWIDFTWRAVSVLPGWPEAAPWTVLEEAGGATIFYAGPATIALYRDETANYIHNLTSPRPLLWVRLRATGGGSGYEVVAVTADPSEGEAFTEAGDDLVETVAMPEPVRAAVQSFVAEHHVERPFQKRKRDRADPEALSRRPPMRQDRDHG
jgi:hypothetical protein